MTPESESDLDGDVDVADDLRVAFARAAHEITPNPVPLAAVARAGRAQRRRRKVALAALAVLCAGTATGVAADLLVPRWATRSPMASVPSVAAPPTVARSTGSAEPLLPPVRTVRPGQRVDAGGGSTVWLTKEGKYWSGPDGFENFRSVGDGNIDRSEPGVSHQSEGDGKGIFHSGLFYGTRDAGKVELTGVDGKKTVATLLELAGRPGWGVWYAHTPPPADPADSPDVALYDRTGKRLTELPGMP
ncbi:hypothetical protein ACIGEZ_08390 [Streptomyces sp. NPDC085481]|uniref:hypothetical protein n=1 Tax=Streptomyces sp. NPDC085481 TaxID=3365727 RepID=UPI0037CFCEFA